MDKVGTQKDMKAEVAEMYKTLIGLVAHLQTGLKITDKFAKDCATKTYFATKARKMHDHFARLNEDLVDLATTLDVRKKGRNATEQKISKMVV